MFKVNLVFVLLVLALIFPTPEPVMSASLDVVETDVQQFCSFDPDCKDLSKPYCNTVYDLAGNYGVCEAVKAVPPVQVIEGEDCPKGKIRQPIYLNEGSEAVCLDPKLAER